MTSARDFTGQCKMSYNILFRKKALQKLTVKIMEKKLMKVMAKRIQIAQIYKI